MSDCLEKYRIDIYNLEKKILPTVMLELCFYTSVELYMLSTKY